MSNKHSERRLAENEVVFRQLNEQIQKGIEEVNQMAAEDGQPEYKFQHNPEDLTLHFYCECSDVNCVERVQVSLHEYNEIHKRRDQFVVIPGHDMKNIEKVIQRNQGFVVVQKFIDPPDTIGRFNTVKA